MHISNISITRFRTYNIWPKGHVCDYVSVLCHYTPQSNMFLSCYRRLWVDMWLRAPDGYGRYRVYRYLYIQ